MGTYDSLSSYFSQSGGNSSGKGGGAGYATDTSNALRVNNSGSGDTTTQTPSSGSAGLVSVAAGVSATDKSAFTSPFEQSFGGISNNQIIQSPGATGASTAGGQGNTMLWLALAAVAALVLWRR